MSPRCMRVCEKTGPISATPFNLFSNDSANMTKHVLTQTTLIIKWMTPSTRWTIKPCGLLDADH